MKGPLGLAVPALRLQRRADLPASVAVRPPGSKSLTNRALALAALARGGSTLTGASVEAGDGAAILAGAAALGATIRRDGLTLRVEGAAGRPAGGGVVDAAESGTTARFLAAAAALGSEPTTVTGRPRLRQRPMAPLFQALRQAGAHVEADEGDRLPARLWAGREGLRGGSVALPGDVSSQFLSALLLIGPWCREGLTVELTTPLVSRPYVAMTVALLRQVGARVEQPEPQRYAVEPTGVDGFALAIEPDASGAMVFAAAAALLPGMEARVEGVGSASLQGDVALLGALEAMGARIELEEDAFRCSQGAWPLRPVDVDLTDMPDQAMTLAALACFADGPSTLRGLGTLRDKECDRLEATASELGRIGARVEIVERDAARGCDEALRIEPPAGLWRQDALERPVRFRTHNDHRMAMTLALLGLRLWGVEIDDPACVAKTYPTFWEDFTQLALVEPVG